LKKKKKLSEKSEVMYTSVEAADLLGVSPRTIQLWTDSGVLQARKTSGGHRRFPESVLEAFLQTLNAEDRPLEDSLSPLPTKPFDVYQVLIAEDEPDLRTLYESTMASWGLPLNVKSVKDGYDALIRLGVDRPDLLIVDLNLPKMDGFHMLNAIHNAEGLVNTQIVVITALSKSDIINRGGIPDGIPVYHKPIPFKRLQQFIKTKIDDKRRSG
jgi:excisionase family DNA binding protein